MSVSVSAFVKHGETYAQRLLISLQSAFIFFETCFETFEKHFSHLEKLFSRLVFQVRKAGWFQYLSFQSLSLSDGGAARMVVLTELQGDAIALYGFPPARHAKCYIVSRHAANVLNRSRISLIPALSIRIQQAPNFLIIFLIDEIVA